MGDADADDPQPEAGAGGRTGSAQPPGEPGYYLALGRAIKVLRTERGIERKDLAEAAGVSYAYLSEIENGKKRPSSKSLVAIAEALGLRPYELLETAEAWVPTMTSGLTGSVDPAKMAWLDSPAPQASLHASASAAEPRLSAPEASSPERPAQATAGRSRITGLAKLLRRDAPRAEGPAPVVGRASGQGAGQAGSSEDTGTFPLLKELAGLAEGLSPEDLQRLLDLARRLQR